MKTTQMVIPGIHYLLNMTTYVKGTFSSVHNIKLFLIYRTPHMSTMHGDDTSSLEVVGSVIEEAIGVIYHLLIQDLPVSCKLFTIVGDRSCALPYSISCCDSYRVTGLNIVLLGIFFLSR